MTEKPANGLLYSCDCLNLLEVLVIAINRHVLDKSFSGDILTIFWEHLVAESLREELLENILEYVFLGLDVFLGPDVAVLNLCTLRINSVHVSKPF